MPRLVIKQGPGVGRDHALSGGVCTVGRDPQVEFVLEDTLVSRRHFKVVHEEGAYYVEDLGSTNGTILNGSRAQRARLADGDTIRIGGTQIQFVQKDLLGGPRKPARPKAVEAPQQPARPAPAPAPAPKEEIVAPVRRRRKLR
jgi:pSer/pThr/pTyr-binding forkhead associated (FHA) protein